MPDPDGGARTTRCAQTLQFLVKVRQSFTVSLWRLPEPLDVPGKPSSITSVKRCQIAALACEAPSESERPISQWTSREIADEIMKRGIVAKISPREAARLLKKKGLKPHLFRYWLTPAPDPQREEKIEDICTIYKEAAEQSENGERIVSIDEMTGVQAKERKHPNLPMQPSSPEVPGGRVEKQEFEYIRHGTLSFFINFDVANRKVIVPSSGPRRKQEDMLSHVQKLVDSDKTAKKWHLIVDNLNTHFVQPSTRWHLAPFSSSIQERETKQVSPYPQKGGIPFGRLLDCSSA